MSEWGGLLENTKGRKNRAKPFLWLPITFISCALILARSTWRKLHKSYRGKVKVSQLTGRKQRGENKDQENSGGSTVDKTECVKLTQMGGPRPRGKDGSLIFIQTVNHLRK